MDNTLPFTIVHLTPLIFKFYNLLILLEIPNPHLNA